MNDTPYTNRELDTKFSDILDALGRIEKQTTATNGKVAAISKTQERWKGATSVIVLFITVILVPTLGVALLQLFADSQHIAAIDAVITQLESH